MQSSNQAIKQMGAQGGAKKNCGLQIAELKNQSEIQNHQSEILYRPDLVSILMESNHSQRSL